ncbi:MAG: flagellar basal body rod protein FlgB [Candidatus Glassbacteria bacterium]|nr:flagellar basal body rod protein FlgB [Candidatus Glassbacteria bacterium]
MLNKFLFEQTNLPLLHKGLDTYALRQQASAHNIANVNTHGFRRMEVKFEEELRKALKIENGINAKMTDRNHFKIGAGTLDQVEPVVYMPTDDELHSGINNVDIDVEMVRLAKAQLSFDFAARMSNRTFSGLRSAIRGDVSS